MSLASLFVVSMMIVAPAAATYFRRLAAVGSIAAVILARAACENGARDASIITLIVVTLVLAMEGNVPSETSHTGRQATENDCDHTLAERIDERGND